eukprot:4687815-Amphidinium_carterae.1
MCMGIAQISFGLRNSTVNFALRLLHLLLGLDEMPIDWVHGGQVVRPFNHIVGISPKGALLTGCFALRHFYRHEARPSHFQETGSALPFLGFVAGGWITANTAKDVNNLRDLWQLGQHHVVPVEEAVVAAAKQQDQLSDLRRKIVDSGPHTCFEWLGPHPPSMAVQTIDAWFHRCNRKRPGQLCRGRVEPVTGLQSVSANGSRR